MSKYADVLKKSINQTLPVSSGDERVTVTDEKPASYGYKQPPTKRGDCNYDRWERAYFTYLVEMYRIMSGYELEWNPAEMYQFFQFIYYVSSGEISHHLEKFTQEQEEAYFEYLIKRNNFYY